MNVQSTIYNFLTTQAGLTPDQAYGVMGNLEVESSLNPASYNPNEKAIGIVQWEGGRRAALQAFAAARGTSETDLQTQLEFMLHEWQTTESSAYQAIKSAGSPEQAAALDDQYYERSSGAARQQREQDAAALAGGETMPQSAGETLLTPDAKTTKQDLENSVDELGLGSLSAVLTAVPELNKLLNEAIAKQWTPQQFQNQVQQSNWYRDHSEAAKRIIALQYSDPAEYKSELSQAYQTVRQQAHAEGVDLSKDQIKALGMDYITKTWSQQTLSNEIGQQYNGSGADNGQAAQYKTQLEQLYTDYGLPWTDAHMKQKLQKLLSGQVTMDAYQRLAQQEAQSLYPSIATQLQGGMTVQDVASPYINTMANLLEVDPNTIKLTDPKIKKALQGTVTTVNGKSTVTSTPLWQFEQQVRSDPRWGNTDNAHQAVSSFLTQIGHDWGFLGT